MEESFSLDEAFWKQLVRSWDSFHLGVGRDPIFHCGYMDGEKSHSSICALQRCSGVTVRAFGNLSIEFGVGWGLQRSSPFISQPQKETTQPGPLWELVFNLDQYPRSVSLGSPLVLSLRLHPSRQPGFFLMCLQELLSRRGFSVLSDLETIFPLGQW